jgi:hypothetical protein
MRIAQLPCTVLYDTAATTYVVTLGHNHKVSFIERKNTIATLRGTLLQRLNFSTSCIVSCSVETRVLHSS